MLVKIRNYKVLIILVWILIALVSQALHPYNFTTHELGNKPQAVTSVSSSLNPNFNTYCKEIQSGFYEIHTLFPQKILGKMDHNALCFNFSKRIIPSEFLKDTFNTIIPLYLQGHRLNI